MQGHVQESNAQHDRAHIRGLIAKAEVAESLSNTLEKSGDLEGAKAQHSKAEALRAEAKGCAKASGQLLHLFD